MFVPRPRLRLASCPERDKSVVLFWSHRSYHSLSFVGGCASSFVGCRCLNSRAIAAPLDGRIGSCTFTLIYTPPPAIVVSFRIRNEFYFR